MYQAQLSIVCLTTQYGPGDGITYSEHSSLLSPSRDETRWAIREEWLTRLAKWRRENLHAGQSQVKPGMKPKCHTVRHFSFMLKSTSAVWYNYYSVLVTVFRIKGQHHPFISLFLSFLLSISISISSSFMFSTASSGPCPRPTRHTVFRVAVGPRVHTHHRMYACT